MMVKEEYCKGCVHLSKCKGEAYQYGDCASGGPYGTNKDYSINASAATIALPFCKSQSRLIFGNTGICWVLTGKKPNWWFRLWHRLFFQFRWEEIE